MKDKRISQSGITLIALIITIIVMLILVAVTVSTVVNSGLFGHTKDATGKWATEQAKEANIGNDNYIKDTVNNNGGGSEEGPDTPPKEPEGATPGERVTENTEYTSDGKTAMIPAKFTVSGLASEQSIDGGLVIYLIPEGTTVDWTNPDEVETAQRTYDQFVWIPISDINDMYMCQSEDGTKSCNITVENGKAKCTTHDSELMAGRLYATGTGEKFDSTLTNQTYIANTGIREPDVVTARDNTAKLSVINRILGTNYTDFKQLLQEEYNEIVKSVYENHGFYVGRYETSNITFADGTAIKSVAGVIPSNSTSWYYMYAQQRNYANNNDLAVGSTMLQGAAYDQVMKFVHNTASYDVKAKTNAEHSFSAPYQTGGINYSGTKTYNDTSKNIFDLEGNVMAWTTEANDTIYRVVRGGNYGKYNHRDSASSRYSNGTAPDGGGDDTGSVSQLYIK